MSGETDLWVNQRNVHVQLAATQIALMSTLNVVISILQTARSNGGVLPEQSSDALIKRALEIFDKLDSDIRVAGG